MGQFYKLWGVFTIILIGIISSGCGDKDDKSRIQQEIDGRNPKQKQAFCVRVSGRYKTTLNNNVDIYGQKKYDDGLMLNEKLSYYLSRKQTMDNERYLKLSLFEKMGLLEENIEFNKERPYTQSYLFYLTNKGKQYANIRGGLNFCFGRVIVDEVLDTVDSQSTKGVNFKSIHFTYHLEGVPDWMKDESIYNLYSNHTTFIDLVLGKQLTGTQTYKVADDGSLTVWEGIRGNRYIL